MNRRTRQLLAQMVQQMEQSGPSAAIVQAGSAQTTALEHHLDVWDRLSAVRRIDLDPRDVAAGRERMLAALLSAPIRGRSVFSLLLTPILRSAAIVLGLLVLTGAAAGASAALGGPHIWRTVGVSRNSDRATERSESSEMNPTGDGSGSVPAGGGSNAIADADGPTDGPSSGGGSDVDGDYVHDEESEAYNEGVTSGAVPSGGAEGSGAGHGAGAASSTPDAAAEEEVGDEKHSATPRLDLTPTPELQDRAYMTYDSRDENNGDDVDEVDDDAVDHENEDSTYAGDDEKGSGGGNPAPSAAAQPRRGPSNAREDQENPKGQGQNSQQPSRR